MRDRGDLPGVAAGLLAGGWKVSLAIFCFASASGFCSTLTWKLPIAALIEVST